MKTTLQWLEKTIEGFRGGMEQSVLPQRWKWSPNEDFCLCKHVLECGFEQSTSPLPKELEGRRLPAVVERFLLLKPALLQHVKSHPWGSPGSLEKLREWVYTRNCALLLEHQEYCRQRWYSFEEDLEICCEVMKCWHQRRNTCAPSSDWFEMFVVGKNPLLEGRSGVSLYARYKEHLEKEMISAVVTCNDSWTSIKVSLSWLKQMHRLASQEHSEPPLKRMRPNVSRYTWEEDKILCMTVLRVALSKGAFVAPRLNEAWFETNVIQMGLITERSCSSLLSRYTRKLCCGLSKTLSALSSSASAIERELAVLAWLESMHNIEADTETVQVELE